MGVPLTAKDTELEPPKKDAEIIQRRAAAHPLLGERAGVRTVVHSNLSPQAASASYIPAADVVHKIVAR